MRIADQSGCHLTIKRIETDALGRGDVRAKVQAQGHGFSGANKSVWFDRAAIDRFTAELRPLDETREGSTTLETMSPGECSVTFRNSDRVGHILADVTIARAFYHFAKTDHFRCRLIVEIDSTAFPEIINAVEAELAE